MKDLTEAEIEHQKLIQDAKDGLIDYYLDIDEQGRLIHPPKNDDELDEFIQAAFNMRIPRKRVEKDHRAPFEFIADLFFERVKNALGFACRNGGKTQNVAILNFLDMLFKPGCEVASAGAVRDQADKCYSYFKKYVEMPWFVRFCKRWQKQMGRYFVEKALQSSTNFASGSKQEVLTGSEKGLRSPHPNKARLDEIDLLPWSIIQTALSMARSANGIRGQNVFTSTRQNQHGSMQRLLNEAEAKGITVYEWNIWETLETCTRRCENDPKFGTCPIYKFCKGKAHHCDGFYSIDDFIDKVRMLDQETWETEWLNLRPAKNKLVYHQFSESRHIMTPQRLYKMSGHKQPLTTWARVSGLDFGASPGHPFVYLKFFQLPQGAWLLFHEYYAEQRLIRDHAKHIRMSPLWSPSEAIFADWDRQDRMELKAEQVHTKEANKDVRMGIDHCKKLLEGFAPSFDPMLYIWHECVNTLQELGEYQWPVKADGTVDKSDLPKKESDHAMDAMRYALYSSRKMNQSKYRLRSITGI